MLRPGGGAPQKPPERKIIYTAQVDLVTDELDKCRGELLKLVKDRDGYIAKDEVHGMPGTPRSGTWTVRVPAARFDDFLEAVSSLGEMRRSSRDSDDITDSYYDLQAHIKNDETREEGLRQLYQSKAKDGKLEDLLAVDRELSEVRGKIDTQKGKLQRWDKEVAFSTALITIQDRLAYVPPVPASFSGTIGRTFWGSVDGLISFGKALVVAAVAMAPWLLVAFVLGAPVWYTLRRARQWQPGSAPPPPAQPPSPGAPAP
jgi:hypothetical protein